jgi:hypothetical protein
MTLKNGVSYLKNEWLPKTKCVTQTRMWLKEAWL